MAHDVHRFEGIATMEGMNEAQAMALLVSGYLDGLADCAETDEAREMLMDWKALVERSMKDSEDE